jgi:hypothetical protein
MVNLLQRSGVCKAISSRSVPVQYQVLRKKGTEPPGTGEYNKFKPASGYFACRGCGAKLYECEVPPCYESCTAMSHATLLRRFPDHLIKDTLSSFRAPWLYFSWQADSDLQCCAGLAPNSTLVVAGLRFMTTYPTLWNASQTPHWE